MSKWFESITEMIYMRTSSNNNLDISLLLFLFRLGDFFNV